MTARTCGRSSAVAEANDLSSSRPGRVAAGGIRTEIITSNGCSREGGRKFRRTPVQFASILPQPESMTTCLIRLVTCTEAKPEPLFVHDPHGHVAPRRLEAQGMNAPAATKHLLAPPVAGLLSIVEVDRAQAVVE